MSKKKMNQASDLHSREILKHVRPGPHTPSQLSEQAKIEKITKNFKEIMEALGLDLENDSLAETPGRIARMYVKELFAGLAEENFPRITVIQNNMNYDEMLTVQGIEVISVCEHHFQVIDGRATVAYIPNKRVIGLSKINRVVQYFSRRPQVQERLTRQIGDALEHILQTEHVAVHINARHYCVIARGVEDRHSITVTSDLRGNFKNKSDIRQEFLSLCRSKTGGS